MNRSLLPRRWFPWAPILGQRFRNAWAASSWFTRAAFLALTWAAGSLTGLTLMTSTNAGVTKVLQLVAAGQSTRSSVDAWWVRRTAPAPEESGSKALEQALAPTVPTMDAWASRLANGRVLDTPMTLHIRPWSAVTPRMQTLAQAQGITLLAWPDQMTVPDRLDRVRNTSQFWANQATNKTWTVAGNPSDLLRSRTVDGSTLTDMDIVRLLLWSDALPVVARWHAEHPAPAPPDQMLPPNIDVQFISGQMGAGMLFWNAVACLVLLASTAGVLTALLNWDALRRDGLLEPLMALPIPDRRLVGVLWGGWALWGSLVWLGALLLGSIILVREGLPGSLGRVATVALLVESAWLLSLAVALAVLTVFPGRWWRMGGRLFLAGILLLLELNGYAALTDARALAAILDAPWSGWVAVPAGMLVVGCLLGAGRRVALQNRLGWRRV